MNDLNSVRRASRLAAPAMVLLSACYTQIPMTTDVPAPSTRIIATVTDSGTVVMANKIGPGAQAVEGVVTAADAKEWTLSLVQVEYRGGTSVQWSREVVTFPRYALTNPTVKRVDMAKSWIAGGLVAASVFIVAKAFGAVGTSDNGGTTPSPPAIRIPGGGR